MRWRWTCRLWRRGETDRSAADAHAQAEAILAKARAQSARVARAAANAEAVRRRTQSLVTDVEQALRLRDGA